MGTLRTSQVTVFLTGLRQRRTKGFVPEDFRPGFLYPSLVWLHFIQGKRIRDGSGLRSSGPYPLPALRGQIWAKGAVGLQGGQYCCSVLQLSAYTELCDRVSQRCCSSGLEGTDRALCLLFHKSWVITSWPQTPLWSHRCPALGELRSRVPCTARWAHSLLSRVSLHEHMDQRSAGTSDCGARQALG